MNPKTIPEIVDLASAYYGSAVLFAAIDANVFAALGDGATVEEVAAGGGLDGRGVRLLLDACAAIGLVEKSGNVYRNTPAGAAALVPGGPADLTRAIRYNRDVYPVWGRLGELVRTGRPPEKPEIHLGVDPARTRAFADAMFARAMGIGRGVTPMVAAGMRETSGANGRLAILDLAGGPGAYAIQLCQALPQAHCTTVDLPAISDAAREYVAKAQLSGRIECRAGDYHRDRWGDAAYDAVTIFGALHQEQPADIVDILRRARAALKPGGRIFILDMMTDSTHTSPPFSALFAVNMALTAEHGWVFSDEELKSYLAEAGFEPGATRPVPPPMPHWLVDATAR